MRACRGSRLASARSFISLPPLSAPQERISSAQRADIVLPTGQDFVREADFVLPLSRFKYSYKREMGKFSRMMIVPAQLRCARISITS